MKIKVSIPKDAKIGNYAVLITFAEKVPEGDVAGRHPNFQGKMQLNVKVWVLPTVRILTPYVNDLVEAGEEYAYEIKLRNTGNQDISISQEIIQEGGIIYYKNTASSTVSSSTEPPGTVSSPTEPSLTASSSTESSPSALSSAKFSSTVRQLHPLQTGCHWLSETKQLLLKRLKKIKVGQIFVLKLKLAVPTNVKGSYIGSLDLNIDDPGISEYERRISLSFCILPVLKEPYETTFEARTVGSITSYNCISIWIRPLCSNRKSGSYSFL